MSRTDHITDNELLSIYGAGMAAGAGTLAIRAGATEDQAHRIATSILEQLESDPAVRHEVITRQRAALGNHESTLSVMRAMRGPGGPGPVPERCTVYGHTTGARCTRPAHHDGDHELEGHQ